MYQLIFFVPETHLETVKDAVFRAGAGRYNNYDNCCWQSQGTGQFRPLENSNAYIGEKGKLEKVPEYRVEMLCADEYIDRAVSALKNVHPYEEPAYYAVRTYI